MNPEQAGTFLNATLKGLPPYVAAIVVLAFTAFVILRMFKADVSAMMQAKAACEIEKTKVHSATLTALSGQVAAVSPTVIAAVQEDGGRTRALVSSTSGEFTEELTQGLGAIRASIPTVCPIAAVSRPSSCPVTPATGTAIPPTTPAAPAEKVQS
jgi:hypothetical protein